MKVSQSKYVTGIFMKLDNTDISEVGLIEILFESVLLHSIINTQLVVRDTYQIEYRPEICKGDFVQVGTRLYDSTGIYIDTFQLF